MQRIASKVSILRDWRTLARYAAMWSRNDTAFSASGGERFSSVRCPRRLAGQPDRRACWSRARASAAILDAERPRTLACIVARRGAIWRSMRGSSRGHSPRSAWAARIRSPSILARAVSSRSRGLGRRRFDVGRANARRRATRVRKSRTRVASSAPNAGAKRADELTGDPLSRQPAGPVLARRVAVPPASGMFRESSPRRPSVSGQSPLPRGQAFHPHREIDLDPLSVHTNDHRAHGRVAFPAVDPESEVASRDDRGRLQPRKLAEGRLCLCVRPCAHPRNPLYLAPEGR